MINDYFDFNFFLSFFHSLFFTFVTFASFWFIKIKIKIMHQFNHSFEFANIENDSIQPCQSNIGLTKRSITYIINFVSRKISISNLSNDIFPSFFEHFCVVFSFFSSFTREMHTLLIQNMQFIFRAQSS